jgi:WD40 repeat protein
MMYSGSHLRFITGRRQVWDGAFCEREPGHVLYGERIEGGEAGSVFCAFQDDGELLTCSTARGIFGWRLAAQGGSTQLNLEQLQLRENSKPPLCVDPSGACALLTLPGSDRLWLVDVPGQSCYTLHGLGQQPSCSAIAVQGNQRLAVAGDKQGNALVWSADSSTGSCSLETTYLMGHAGGVCSCCIKGDGRLAATGGMDSRLIVYDISHVADGAQQVHEVWVQEEVSCCSFSPDGKMLAYGTASGRVGLLHIQQASGRLQPLRCAVGRLDRQPCSLRPAAAPVFGCGTYPSL